MSVANSSSDHEAVGTTRIHRAISKAEEDDFYRCRWKLKGKFMSEFKETKSPIFTVPNREKCKWYLSVHPLDDGEDKGNLFFSTRLHLDPKSECEAAVAEFRTLLDDRELEFTRSCAYRTFKFTKKFENSAAILSIIPSRELQRDYDDDDDEIYELTVLCTIMVKTVIPEDDSFPNDFGSLLKNERFTDVAILAGPREKKFPAHKVILSARSSVFAAMIAHDTTENEGVVNIKNIREEVVEEMLRYIYTGEVEKLDENLAQDVLIAADKYDLKGLKKKCEGILIGGLSSSSAFDLLLFAESYNASELRFEAIHLIRRKKTELMKTPGWENLNKSNPALVREISEPPQSRPKSDSDSDVSYEISSHSDTDSE